MLLINYTKKLSEIRQLEQHDKFLKKGYFWMNEWISGYLLCSHISYTRLMGNKKYKHYEIYPYKLQRYI